VEISVRDLKARLSEYLRRATAGEELIVTSRGKEVARLIPPRSRRRAGSAAEEAIARVRSLPGVRPGRGRPRLPRAVTRLEAGEKSLSDLVSEERR
jgi:prevent-host-death family protein